MFDVSNCRGALEHVVVDGIVVGWRMVLLAVAVVRGLASPGRANSVAPLSSIGDRSVRPHFTSLRG